MRPIFITGTGTDVGKTVAAAIIAMALDADYWKPVQAGIDAGTDSEWVGRQLEGRPSRIHDEAFKLHLAASPHLAARAEGIHIDLPSILQTYRTLPVSNPFIIIEGAGGLMAPLNDTEFVIDLVETLQAEVILVSRNYLGSINHSLLTAAACKSRGIRVLGWVFNDEYMHYQDEIAAWTGYPVIGEIPHLQALLPGMLEKQALLLKDNLLAILEKSGI